MDNQQDQFGTPNAANAGRTSQTPNSAASGASAAARKPAAMPVAQGNPSAAASGQTTANAGANRQGEGQQTNDQEGTFLDSALNSGKKWIEDSGVLASVNQLPQSLKDLGNRALDKVNGLSTTQKVVGGAILAAGIGWLATRKGQSSSDSSGSYNYGRQRDAGSYGRRSYGYQTPDAATSRRSASGLAGRSDSSTPYGNSGSDSSTPKSNTGIQSGSGRDSGSASGSGSTRTNHGSQYTSGSSSRSKDDGFSNVE